MDDLISRQAAIESIYHTMRTPSSEHEWKCIRDGLLAIPSAQPTLYGYDIEHLKLIAIILQKENLPPERIAEALTDIGGIVAMVKEEFEEGLRKAVARCMI